MMWKSGFGTIFTIGCTISALNIALFSLVSPVQAAHFVDGEVYSNYDQVGLEELSDPSKKFIDSISGSTRAAPVLDSTTVFDLSVPNSPATVTTYKSNHDMKIIEPKFDDVKNHKDKNISETLFILPKEQTTELTSLIAGKEQPTFIHNDVVKPIISSDKNKKVLASYRILVPILIPAIKKKPDTMKLQKDDVEFVQETYTEMVPVKKEVVHPKTVVKAERVPQKLITEFVKKDKVQGDEKLIKSVSLNFD